MTVSPGEGVLLSRWSPSIFHYGDVFGAVIPLSYQTLLYLTNKLLIHLFGCEGMRGEDGPVLKWLG